MPRPNLIRLNCECLEARDVPAIILAGTQATTGSFPRTVTPNGGAMAIQEVVFAATDIVVTTEANGSNFANADAATRNKSETASDIITLSKNGGTLTINASDGIFLRYTNANGTFFQFRGNTLTIDAVTGLKVDLQLGGDDKIVDRTNFNASLIGGAGKDTIVAIAWSSESVRGSTALSAGCASAHSLLTTLTPRKTLLGQTGGDTLIAPRFGFKIVLHGGRLRHSHRWHRPGHSPRRRRSGRTAWVRRSRHLQHHRLNPRLHL